MCCPISCSLFILHAHNEILEFRTQFYIARVLLSLGSSIRVNLSNPKGGYIFRKYIVWMNLCLCIVFFAGLISV